MRVSTITMVMMKAFSLEPKMITSSLARPIETVMGTMLGEEEGAVAEVKRTEETERRIEGRSPSRLAPNLYNF